MNKHFSMQITFVAYQYISSVFHWLITRKHFSSANSPGWRYAPTTWFQITCSQLCFAQSSDSHYSESLSLGRENDMVLRELHINTWKIMLIRLMDNFSVLFLPINRLKLLTYIQTLHGASHDDYQGILKNILWQKMLSSAESYIIDIMGYCTLEHTVTTITITCFTNTNQLEYLQFDTTSVLCKIIMCNNLHAQSKYPFQFLS